MTAFAPVTSIDRVEAPTRREFEEEYVKRRKPVIITGVGEHWKAYQWTPAYLKKVAGKDMCTVHYNARADFKRWYTRMAEREDKKMKFAKFLNLVGTEGERRYYMTEHILRDINPKLCEDISMAKYIDDKGYPVKGSCTGPALFIGRDTCMPLHFHGTTEAFMCQLHGTKKVTLYGPEQSENLYMRPWHTTSYVFSEIEWLTQRAMAGHDPASLDLDRWPRLRHVEPLEFTVNPGEILYIPVHWWHVTTVAGFQISMTYFWMSDKSRWHYPLPGEEVDKNEAFRTFLEMCKAFGVKDVDWPSTDDFKIRGYGGARAEAGLGS